MLINTFPCSTLAYLNSCGIKNPDTTFYNEIIINTSDNKARSTRIILVLYATIKIDLEEMEFSGSQEKYINYKITKSISVSSADDLLEQVTKDIL